MKKVLSVMLALLLTVSILAACSKTDKPPEAGASKSSSQASEADTSSKA